MADFALPRRFQSLLWFLLLVFVVFILVSLRGDVWSSLPSPPQGWRVPFTTDDGILSWMGKAEDKEPLRIALLESIGTHDEVAAALLHALGGQYNTELSLFSFKQRYHMDDIMANFTLIADTGAVNSTANFTVAMHEAPPHILVSTTCELDLEKKGIVEPLQYLLDNSTTHLFCVMHHADRWSGGGKVDMAKKWAAQDRLDFIGLSQHTVDFLVNKTVSKWGFDHEVATHVFPPVFPIRHAEFDPADGLPLAIQGDYSPERRDYQGIFGQLTSVIRKANESETFDEVADKVSLHLIGHGKRPVVPEAVQDHVMFDEGLSYPEFYRLMSSSFAVLPAFASGEYLDRKASSTIPASLIAGAPLVATEAILEAYSYLPRDAVWMTEDGESEMDVIERVIGNRAEYTKKMKLMRAAALRLMEENRANIGDWISAARQKVKAVAAL